MTPAVGTLPYYWELVLHSLGPIVVGGLLGTIPLTFFPELLEVRTAIGAP